MQSTASCGQEHDHTGPNNYRANAKMGLRKAVRKSLKSLSAIGLDINLSLDRGVSVLGLNIARSHHPETTFSAVALQRCLAFSPTTVLDVGSGGGQHAAAFALSGAAVTCIDFGTSVYAERATDHKGVNVVHSDFVLWQSDRQYSLVWASHVLEHQRNVGQFIEKLLSCCAPDGRIAITVPFPHRRLWGGHLSLWTPGLLVYNIVLCGIDLSSAMLFYGHREISVIFQPRHATLPPLTYDSGDLNALSHLMPCGFKENADPWI